MFYFSKEKNPIVHEMKLNMSANSYQQKRTAKKKQTRTATHRNTHSCNVAAANTFNVGQSKFDLVSRIVCTSECECVCVLLLLFKIKIELSDGATLIWS